MPVKKISYATHFLSFLSLMIFWVIMSGFFDAIHITMGVASVIFVMVVNHKLKSQQFFEDDIDVLSKLRFGRAFYYVFWLLWQIIIAGFQVAAVILKPSMPVGTSILKFKADLPCAQAKIILGNSITLTPGTLTVDISGNEFIVHSLTPVSMEGILDDSIPQQVLQLFQKELHPVVYDAEIVTDNDKLS